MERYPDHGCPIWAFLEAITLGTFLRLYRFRGERLGWATALWRMSNLRLYRFCGERLSGKEMHDGFYLPQAVKGLRNPGAHNNCILNNLVSGTGRHNVQPAVSQALARVDGLGRPARRSGMGNDRVQQIATTLYVHRELASEGVREYRAQSLHEFCERMGRHFDCYKDNFQASSTFDFLEKVFGRGCALSFRTPAASKRRRFSEAGCASLRRGASPASSLRHQAERRRLFSVQPALGCSSALHSKKMHLVQHFGFESRAPRRLGPGTRFVACGKGVSGALNGCGAAPG